MVNRSYDKLSREGLATELRTLKAEHNALLESARSILQYQDFETSAGSATASKSATKLEEVYKKADKLMLLQKQSRRKYSSSG